MSSTLSRLKKRKLVEWTLPYLGGSWLIMQLVDVLSELHCGMPGLGILQKRWHGLSKLTRKVRRN